MIKILIADDHPIVRRGLREILEDEKDMAVNSEVSSAPEVLESLLQNDIDVVLLDISMPGRSGLDIIQDILNEYPTIRILVLSALHEEVYAKRVIKIGAHGYMNKESAPDQLITAIRKVYSGKRYISIKLSEQIAEDLSKGNKGLLHENLSSREFEVFRYLGSGNSIGEIAKNLNLSITTISTYRTRILEKTGLKNNSEIIKYCLSEKLFIDD